MSATITRDEWLAEVERVLSQPRGCPEDGLTMHELGVLLGRSTRWVGEQIRHGPLQGRFIVTRSPALRVDGVGGQTVRYRWRHTDTAH